MNKYQKHYATAKALLETLESVQKDIERKYIAEHNIINEDGTIPTAIYCIDDPDVFDRANLECSELPESKANWQDILSAREILKQAEDQLIAYGLSLAPASVRATLAKSAETNYTTRKKLIDLTFKLDTSTVR